MGSPEGGLEGYPRSEDPSKAHKGIEDIWVRGENRRPLYFLLLASLVLFVPCMNVGLLIKFEQFPHCMTVSE